MGDVQQEPLKSALESSLEERKFAEEVRTKEAQLALERRKLALEFRIKKAELAAKKKEMKAWRNPTFLAILALAGSIIAAVLQARSALSLERTKAQSNLILEAIKTGDTPTAASNLKFLIEVGLLDDPDHKIANRLVSKEGPVLPIDTGDGISNIIDLRNKIRVGDRATAGALAGVQIRIHGTNRSCPPTDFFGETRCPTQAGDHLDVSKKGYEELANVEATKMIWLVPIRNTP